jgi:hypothetical protein
MATSPVALAQTKFLMNGGGYELALAQKRERGELPESYVFHEYPKAIRIGRGMSEPTLRQTDTCKGTQITWTEPAHEMFETITVHSEEEEERVLAGGMTSAEIEDQRHGLIARCHNLSIPVDPSWSVVRLRRELGDALDAPAPENDMARLEAELAGLRKMQAMQAEIEALRAQLSQNESPIEEMGDARKGRK